MLCGITESGSSLTHSAQGGQRRRDLFAVGGACAGYRVAFPAFVLPPLSAVGSGPVLDYGLLDAKHPRMPILEMWQPNGSATQSNLPRQIFLESIGEARRRHPRREGPRCGCARAEGRFGTRSRATGKEAGPDRRQGRQGAVEGEEAMTNRRSVLTGVTATALALATGCNPTPDSVDFAKTYPKVSDAMDQLYRAIGSLQALRGRILTRTHGGR